MDCKYKQSMMGKQKKKVKLNVSSYFFLMIKIFRLGWKMKIVKTAI